VRKTNIKIWLLISIVIILICGSFAYVLTGQKWPIGTVVGFYINPNTGQVTNEADAVRSAANSWSQVFPAGLRLFYSGSTFVTDYGRNDLNTVCWKNEGASGTLAHSYWWYWLSNNEIIETDLLFNDHYSWSTSGGDYDIETVALHEFGHSVGLAHSDTGIMQPRYSGIQRSIDSDVRAGFMALYGPAEEGPSIELDRQSLSFTGSVGEPSPPSQIFKVRNSGEQTLNYQIDTTHWISVSPSSGSSTGEWDEITTWITVSGLGSGDHTGNISVTGNADNSPQNLTVRLTVLEDRPPTVSITSPQNGDLVSGTVLVKADVTDDKGVTKVEFYLDNSLSSTDYNAPYEWSWNSNTASIGYHTIKARAYDTINQTAEHSVQVEIRDRPPEVSITSPKEGATVSKTITIRANATDDKGVTKVEFYIDNKLIHVNNNSPYNASWDTTKYSSGYHTIKARAYDTINQTGDDSIQVKVDQPPEVTISSPTDGANVSGIVTIQAKANDDFGIKKVQFYINGELLRKDSKHPYEYNWNTTQTFNGSYRIRTTVYDTINQTDTDLINVELIPHAPLDFSGNKVENRALLQREFINVLTWKSNPYNRNITNYRIYQLAGSDRSLVEESSSDTFEYWHRNVNKDDQYQYALVAVDNQGREGNPALLTVQ